MTGQRLPVRAVLAVMALAVALAAPDAWSQPAASPSAPLSGSPSPSSTAVAPTPPLPADSVYHYPGELTDQDGGAFTLAARRGRPQLVAMFYTSCRYVCPLIIDSARAVEHALAPEERAGLDVLLVSLDPARDDVAALKRVFERRRLPADRWTFARTDERSVRALAALLGVRYRALSDGEFNHTSSLVLLDADGRRVATTATLGTVPDPAFVAQVRETLRRGAAAPARP
jgi:protein SCO1/2